MHHHMPCSTGPCLPVEVGSGAVMCPVALDLASLIGRAPVCHVSYSSGSCLPTGEGSRAPCVLQLQILPPYGGGLWSTTCPTAPDSASLLGGLRCRHCMPCNFLWTVGLRYIKRGLDSLPKQIGSRVSKPRAHVPYASNARAIMGLQDVQIGDVIITCKMCGQAATVLHRPCWPLAGHYYSAR
jgi:hypothetical protein